MKSKEFVYVLLLLVSALLLSACESDADVVGSLAQPLEQAGIQPQPSGETGVQPSAQTEIQPSAQTGMFRVLPQDDTDDASFDGSSEDLTASKWQSAFLKFDLNEFQKVDRAVLKLYVENANGGSPVGKAIPVNNDNWTEESSNLPEVSYNAEVIGESAATPEGRYLSIDVTNYIKNESSNDGVATIAFKTDNDKWLKFGSKEGVNPPRLEVQGSTGGALPAAIDSTGSLSDQTGLVEVAVVDNQESDTSSSPITEPEPVSEPATVTTANDSSDTSEPQEPVTEAPVVASPQQNQSPTAVISANTSFGTAPVTVNVNAGGSSDPDGSIVSYSWDFGDGSRATGMTASHTYNNAGDYSLRLTVEDNAASTASSSIQISVQAQTVSSSNGQCENPGSDFNMSVPSGGALAGDKPRVFVSTDIRPFSDPGEYDDKLSVISMMLFLDVIDLEGIAGNPDPVRRIIDAYQSDLANLRSYSSAYPDPSSIKLSKSNRSEDGADLLLEAAKKPDSRPLYVLVWGSPSHLARALEKAEQQNFDLASKIRVLAVGLGNVYDSSGPRDSFIDVYAKVKQGKLWMVLDQEGHRGIFRYGNLDLPAGNWKPSAKQGADNFVDHHIKDHGNLGRLYHGVERITRMGDFPTFLYLLRGNPSQPNSDHWGGRFIGLNAAHKFGSSGTDSGLRNFWTDVQSGDITYTNPWRRSISNGSHEMVTQFAMQWLPEFSERFDRAKYRKGSNPSPVDVFKYTNRCQ